MKKTILLGIRNDFSVVWNKRLHLITGMAGSLAGLSFIIRDGHWFWLIFGAFMLGSGLYQIIFGFMAFSKKSKYAPRVLVDESVVFIKERVLKQGILIPWDQIRNIQMAHNHIVFSMRDVEYDFCYEVNARTSLNIKSAIRKVAESKHIEVIGG